MQKKLFWSPLLLEPSCVYDRQHAFQYLRLQSPLSPYGCVASNVTRRRCADKVECRKFVECRCTEVERKHIWGMKLYRVCATHPAHLEKAPLIHTYMHT